MRKNGQAALEFLMTYGWAFLLILVLIGGLSYFGVLKPEQFTPEKCTVSTGFSCTEAVSSSESDRIIVNLKYSPGSISLSDLDVDVNGATNCLNPTVGPVSPLDTVYKANQDILLVVNCEITDGEVPTATISGKYKTPDGVLSKSFTVETALHSGTIDVTTITAYDAALDAPAQCGGMDGELVQYDRIENLVLANPNYVACVGGSPQNYQYDAVYGTWDCVSTDASVVSCSASISDNMLEFVSAYADGLYVADLVDSEYLAGCYGCNKYISILSSVVTCQLCPGGTDFSLASQSCITPDGSCTLS